MVGLAVGEVVGLVVGDVVGLVVGLIVGEAVGLVVGTSVGETVGLASVPPVPVPVGPQALRKTAKPMSDANVRTILFITSPWNSIIAKYPS